MAGCCGQVAASHSDHYRQVLLYMILLDQGRLAALDRWLSYTVTTIDRFYCILYCIDWLEIAYQSAGSRSLSETPR